MYVKCILSAGGGGVTTTCPVHLARKTLVDGGQTIPIYTTYFVDGERARGRRAQDKVLTAVSYGSVKRIIQGERGERSHSSS